MSYEVRIVGGGRVGNRIADRLENRGDSVVLVEQNEARAVWLETRGYRVHRGDGTDIGVLQAAGADAADIVVVATGDDDSNLLAAQLVRNRFAPDSVIARVNQPDNIEPFEELGIQTVSRPDAIAQMIDMQIESPALTRWMEALGHYGDVQEIEIRNEAVTGSTIREVDEMLPEQVLLVMVGEETEAHLPEQDETVTAGEHVTVIGERASVKEAMRRLTEPVSVADEDAEEPFARTR